VAPGGERDARRLVTLAIAVSLLVWVVADRTGPVWAPALGLGDYPLPVRYAVGWASMTAITYAALGLLRSRDRLLAFATVSLLQSVIAEVLSVLLVVLVQRSASEYVLGELLGQVAAAAMRFATRSRWCRPRSPCSCSRLPTDS
jgi:hypothetical protein